MRVWGVCRVVLGRPGDPTDPSLTWHVKARVLCVHGEQKWSVSISCTALHTSLSLRLGADTEPTEHPHFFGFVKILSQPGYWSDLHGQGFI